MKAQIDNHDKLIDPSHAKKILSALNRIQKAHFEILDLGYSAYVEAEGYYNVMNGETHDRRTGESHQDNVAASAMLGPIDMGGW
jgi:hypothetical protein